jgi:hypothetical protein
MLEMIPRLATEYFECEGGDKEGFIKSILIDTFVLRAYHID